MKRHVPNAALRSLVLILLITSLLLSALPITAAVDEPPTSRGRQSGEFEDGFADDSHGTLSGGAEIRDGFVTLNNTAWTDDFNRAVVAPWENTSAWATDIVKMRNGKRIEMIADDGGLARAAHPMDMVDCRIEVKCQVDEIGFSGPFIEVRTDSGTGYSVDFWHGPGNPGSDMALRIMRGFPRDPIQDGHNVKYSPNNRYPRWTWFPIVAEFLRDGTINFWYDGQFATAPDCFFDGNITNISLGIRKGGKCVFDDLVVKRTYFDGEFVSKELKLPKGMVWDRLEQDSTATYPQLLKVDIQYGWNSTTIPGYSDVRSMSLAGLDPVRHSSIRLRAWLATMDFSLPLLDLWSVSWVNGAVDWMDPFDDGVNATRSGDAVIWGGRATTPNNVLDDQFRRLDITPWRERSQGAEIRNGGLWTLTGGKAEMEGLPPFNDFYLDTIVSLKMIESAGPRLELETTGYQSLIMGWDNSLEEFYVTYSDDTVKELGRKDGRWSEGDALYLSISYHGGRLSVVFGNVYINATQAIPSPFDTVRLSSSLGGMTVWYNITIVTPEESGTVTSVPISPPRGQSWHSLEVNERSGPNSMLNISLLDAATGLPLEGFEDIQDKVTDLQSLFVSDYPSLQVRFDMTGTNWSIPSVNWYRIDWEPLPDDIIKVREFTDIEIDEDSDPTMLFNLSHHFKSRLSTPDRLSYRTVEWDDVKNVSQTWVGTDFYITLPIEDWNGNMTFRFEAFNLDGSVRSEVIKVTVRPVNDAPTISKIPKFTALENHDSPLNVTEYLNDVEIDRLNLTVTTDEVHCTVVGHDLVFNYPTGGEEVDVTVTVSDGELSASTVMVVNITEWNDPPIVDSIDPLSRRENVEINLDLSQYITDEDTPLESLTLVCDHDAVVAIDGLEISLWFEHPSERTEVFFTVSDGTTPVEGLLVLEISDVNDPPELTMEPIYRLDEGEERIFSFGVWDEDDVEGDLEYDTETGPEVGMEVRAGKLVITSIKGKVGEFTVSLTVFDPHGTSDEVSFIVVVSNVNDPPSIPTLVGPLNHSKFMEGEEITFTFEVDDPDMTMGEFLWINFTSDVGGTFARLTSADPDNFGFSGLPVGKHVITVTVSDGQYTRETSLELTVEEDEPDPASSSYLWIVLIIALVVIIVVAVALSTRGEPQTVATPTESEEEPGPEPEEPEVDEGREETIRDVQHAMMGRLGGLPTSLWGWDNADLAEAIVDGPRKELEDGTTVVKVNGNWYNADFSQEETFLDEVEVETDE